MIPDGVHGIPTIPYIRCDGGHVRTAHVTHPGDTRPQTT